MQLMCNRSFIREHENRFLPGGGDDYHILAGGHGKPATVIPPLTQYQLG